MIFYRNINGLVKMNSLWYNKLQKSVYYVYSKKNNYF